MKVVIDEFKIRHGERSIDKAIVNRKEERPIFSESMRVAEEVLKRISSSGRKPFIEFCCGEGATSLSACAEWVQEIESLASRYGGSVRIYVNTGVDLGSISQEEFEKRLNTLRKVLYLTRSPKILANNVLRKRNTEGTKHSSDTVDEGLIFDNEVFDYHFLQVIYAHSIAALAEPLMSDLENLYQPSTYHVVSTPVSVGNFDDFVAVNRSTGISFMTVADLGAGYPAPFIEDAASRIDGVVIVGYSRDRVKSLLEAFRKVYPGILYVGYAVKPVREERSLLNRLFNKISIPIKEEEQVRYRAWRAEQALVFFTARISEDEAIQSIVKAREELMKKTKKQQN